MPVEIEISGQLQEGRPRKQVMHLEQPVSVLTIVEILGLDPEFIGLIVINGIQSELEDIVPPDCRLAFFPPLSGG